MFHTLLCYVTAPFDPLSSGRCYACPRPQNVLQALACAIQPTSCGTGPRQNA